MRKTLLEQFQSQHLSKKYSDIWNKGVHLFSINDRNRDFFHSIFYVNFLFVEVIYNKLNGNIITIKSFTDKDKLFYYMREDFH